MSLDGQRILVNNRYKGDFIPLVINKNGQNIFTGYNYPTFRYTDISQKPIHKLQSVPNEDIGKIILTQGVKYRLFLSENSGEVSFKDNNNNELFVVNGTEHYYSNDTFYEWTPTTVGNNVYKSVYLENDVEYITEIDVVVDETTNDGGEVSFTIQNHVFNLSFYDDSQTIKIDNNFISIIKDAVDKWGSVITDLNHNMNSTISTTVLLKDIPVSTALAGAVITSIIQDPLNAKVYPQSGNMEIQKPQIHSLAYSYTKSGDSILYWVVLHELGHILGIGPHWITNNLRAYYYQLTDDDSHGDTTSLLYIGEHGVFEYNKLFNTINGTSYAFLGIPIEDNFGAGSNTVHLDEGEHPFGSPSPESVVRYFQVKDLYTNMIIPSSINTPVEYPGLDEELMTAKIEDENSNSQGDMPLSRITVGILEDLGYSVNYLNADEFRGVPVDDLQPGPEPEPAPEPEPEPEHYMVGINLH